MRISIITIIISTIVFSFSLAQESSTADATTKTIVIKALSPQKIASYLSGEGMGMALAADKNHYPGPRHVLDYAEQLQLTEYQKAKGKKIYDDMHTQAVKLGKKIIEKEKILDQLFANQKIDEKELHSIILKIAQLKGELRFVHLKAHLLTKGLLSADQISKYEQLRGY